MIRASIFLSVLAIGCAVPLAARSTKLNHWQIWVQMAHGVLLDTPEKAVDFAEAVVRARYGQAEVDEERPFIARDDGDTWEVSGTNGSSRPVGLLPAMSVVTLRKNTGEIVEYRLVSTWRAPG